MKNKLIVIVVVLLVVILFVFFCVYFFMPKGNLRQLAQIKINDKVIHVELAQTESQRSQGLSNRESLPRDHGMLFVFDKASIYRFWMKDMKFPLDFIWINGDKVVDLTENVPAPANNDNLPLYWPKETVNYVLEVNSGFVAENQIKVGDTVEFLY